MQTSTQETLDFAWKTYKNIAKASRENKKQMQSWQVFIFYLTITASIVGGIGGYMQKVPITPDMPFGTILFQLSSSVKAFLIQNHLTNDTFSMVATLGKYFGFLGAILLAVVSYFSSRVLSNDKNQSWQNMRSVAEAIKSKCFLFATSKGEFEKNNLKKNTELFLDQIHEYSNNLQNLVILETDEKLEYPQYPMNSEQYMKLRFQNQYDFYKKEIAVLYVNVNKSEKITLALGLISVILSIVATYFDVAVLITLFTAITTTIASFYTMQKSRELLLRYSSTNKQLDIIREKYISEIMDESTFIVEVERILNNENSAWMNTYTS